MKKQKIMVLVLTGVMISGMVAPTIATATEINNQENQTKVVSEQVINRRSLSEIEQEIEQKILSMGYESVDEYNDAIGSTIPVEQSIYYNNTEYYNAVDSDGRAIPPAVRQWGKRFFTAVWATLATFEYGKEVLGAGIGILVNDTVGVIKNGFPKILPKRTDNVVGYGRVEAGYKVKVAQILLQQHGYKISADGYFGPATESAIKSFQRKINLAADGYVGQHTWTYLIEHLPK